MTTKKKCLQCGNSFIQNRPTQIMCNRTCSARRNAVFAKAVNTKPKIDKTCLCCHRRFSVHLYRVRTGKDKYCSHKCANTLNRIKDCKYDFSQLTAQEIGYIAGFLDADGHISKPKNGQPCVQITNTNKEIIDWFCDKIKIPAAKSHNRYPKQNWNDQYDWRVRTASGCYRFLVFIEPYLKVKKPAAQKLIKFLKKRYHFK